MDTELELERAALVTGRLRELKGAPQLAVPYKGWQQRTADFLCQVWTLWDGHGGTKPLPESEEALRTQNESFYRQLLPDVYPDSDLNYSAMERKYGPLGQALCFLSSELLACVPWAFAGDWASVLAFSEWFLLSCSTLEAEFSDRSDSEAAARALKETLSGFCHDILSDWIVSGQRRDFDPSCDTYTRILRECDPSDPKILYRYGLPVGENERKLFSHLSAMPQSEIDAIASVYTEGYRTGFEVTGRSLEKKKTVWMIYPVGLERIAKAAAVRFEEMGLSVLLRRNGAMSLEAGGLNPRGIYTSAWLPQHFFDHSQDKAFFFDKAYLQRRMTLLGEACEENKDLLAQYAGPALIEMFGEETETFFEDPAKPRLSAAQRKIDTALRAQQGELLNRYAPQEETSFTIISFPLPSIGSDFPAIFDETVRINALDVLAYRRMQQCLIDVLDQGQRVVVKGRGKNRTDMIVSLHPLSDPDRQTNFENCVADVNIPVGEVFTSPVLAGTSGTLHVSSVYLGGIRFEDLWLTFRDGMVTDYGCTNFPDDKEACRRLIEDQILFHHDTLPIGEFAIGTNTEAYRMGRRFGISGKLPILIAEKTGPHFAVGDTCYGQEEEVVTFNPDGKEIIAKENEISALRKTEPEKAYFYCHTDITIPFEELLEIAVETADGRRLCLIRDGRFVVPGTEALNAPLEAMEAEGI